MKNNLEHFSFESIKSPSGISYAEFRKQLSPKYKVVYIDIIKGYVFILVTCVTIALLQFKTNLHWLLIIPTGGILIGYISAYISLFIHEASHYNLHPNKKTNDIIANLLLCLPFGVSLKCYRKIHWQHHLHLGTPSDTEISYFNHLNGLFILETLTGVHLIRTMLSKDKNRLLNHEQIQESRKMLFTGVFIHTAIITSAILINQWFFVGAWITGFVVFFPSFASLRQLLEHRSEFVDSQTDFKKENHGKVSRLFFHTIFSGSFGSAGFTRHMIHHWDPQISYTRMKEIEDFLENDLKTAEILKESRTSYLTVFKKLYKAS